MKGASAWTETPLLRPCGAEPDLSQWRLNDPDRHGFQEQFSPERLFREK